MEINDLIDSLQQQIITLNIKFFGSDETDSKPFYYTNTFSLSKFLLTTNKILNKLILTVKTISDRKLIQQIISSFEAIVEAVKTIIQLLAKLSNQNGATGDPSST